MRDYENRQRYYSIIIYIVRILLLIFYVSMILILQKYTDEGSHRLLLYILGLALIFILNFLCRVYIYSRFYDFVDKYFERNRK